MRLVKILKSFFILALMFITTVFFANADNGANIYFNSLSGTTKSFDINTLQKITFSSQYLNLHFNSSNEIQTISYDVLISFNELESLIEAIEYEKLQISMQFPYIYIRSDYNINAISVYNLQGMQIIQETINSNTTTLSIEPLDPGIYIIIINTNQGHYNLKIKK